MRTSIFVIGILIFGLAGNSFAQTKSADIDSVLHNQNKLLSNQQTIYQEVRYEDPLLNKAYGAEFNPAVFLLGSVQSQTILSGGFSFFKAHPMAEVAFPVYYHSYSIDGLKSSLFTIDSRYRYFLGKHRDGFYLSGGLRFAHLSNEVDEDNSGIVHYTTNKFGVLFGIGYRIYSASGFYWGASLSVGRYFSDDTAHFENLGLDATEYLLDIELLKFGYAF